MMRQLMVALTLVVLLLGGLANTAAAQEVLPLAPSRLSIEQVRGAFVAAGFHVDDPIAWDWTSPPTKSLHVRDLATGRVVLVLVYPDAAAAQRVRILAQRSDMEQSLDGVNAADRGPHLVLGYGESLWLGNVAMVASTQSDLDRLYRAFDDRDIGVFVSPERLRLLSWPHFAVDLDLVQALTNSVVNL